MFKSTARGGQEFENWMAKIFWRKSDLRLRKKRGSGSIPFSNGPLRLVRFPELTFLCESASRALFCVLPFLFLCEINRKGDQEKGVEKRGIFWKWAKRNERNKGKREMLCDSTDLFFASGIFAITPGLLKTCMTWKERRLLHSLWMLRAGGLLFSVPVYLSDV